MTFAPFPLLLGLLTEAGIALWAFLRARRGS